MTIIEINKENYKKEVLECEKAVLIDFYANWCGPCRMLRPILEEVAIENNNIKFASVNVDEESELAKEYNIFSIPCLIIIKEGKEVKRNTGLVSKEELEDIIGEENV